MDHSSVLGGAERSVLELAKAQKVLGHEPLVVVGQSGPFSMALEAIGISAHALGWKSAYVGVAQTARAADLVARVPDLVRAAVALRRYVESSQPDVVQAHTRKAQLVGALALARTNVPLIWHLRDDIPGRAGLRELVKFGLRRADHAVALSAWLSRSYASHGALPRSGRIGLVPSGVDAERLARLPTPWLDGGRSPIVGFIGQIAGWKAPHLLIDAAELAEPGAASFRIIGGVTFPAAEHEYGSWLQNRLTASPARDRIEWLPPTREPSEAFAEIDILVHTSVAPEPFGRVLVEAMAARRPIVAMRKGSATELLNDETAVFAANDSGEALARAIATVIADREASRHRTERAMLKAKMYDPISVATLMEAEYADVIRGCHGSGPR